LELFPFWRFLVRNTLIAISSVALVAAAVAPMAAAQTSLSAAVQTDRATVQQDAANRKNAFAQLKADESAGNAVAVAADRTALQLAHMQARMDFGKLHQDAQGVLQPDQTTLMAALTQLHADQVANNTAAVQADQTAVQNAQAQLKADRGAIFGDLGTGFGKHHRHAQG
jgi:hypothetical protein